MRLRRKPEITGLVNGDRILSELGVNKTWLGMMHYDDKTAAARAKGLLYVGVIASHAKNNFLIWVSPKRDLPTGSTPHRETRG